MFHLHHSVSFDRDVVHWQWSYLNGPGSAPVVIAVVVRHLLDTHRTTYQLNLHKLLPELWYVWVLPTNGLPDLGTFILRATRSSDAV